MKKLYLTTLFVAAMAAIYAQEYNPKINFKKGQVFYYKVEAETESVQSAMGQEMSTTATQTATIVDSVTNVYDDGRTEIIARFRDASIRANVVGMDTVVTYEGVIGAPTMITIDNKGKMISRRVMEEDMGQSLGQFDLDNGMLGQNMFTELPDHPIRTGDQWTKVSLDTIEQASFGGKMRISSIDEYTLGSQVSYEGNNVWEVTFTTQLEIAGEGSIQGMNVTLEGTGVGNGMLYIDPDTGTIVQNESEVENELTVAISGPQSLIVPINQKTQVTFTLKE